MLTITVVGGDSAGRTTNVEEVPFVIGREADCDLTLEDPRVSRHHAQLEVLDDGRVILRDLGSANGTIVDGDRIAGGIWFDVPGTFRVGRTELRVDTGRDQATVALTPGAHSPPVDAGTAVVPPAAVGAPGGTPARPVSERPPGVRAAMWLLVASGAIYILGGGFLLLGVAASRGELDFVPFGILAIVNLILGIVLMVLASRVGQPSYRIWQVVIAVAAGAAVLAALDLVTALSVGLAPWFIVARLALAVGVLGRLWPIREWYKAG